MKYNKFYIGLSKDGQPFNFVLFRPQKNTIRMELKLPRTDEFDKLIEDAGFESIGILRAELVSTAFHLKKKMLLKSPNQSSNSSKQHLRIGPADVSRCTRLSWRYPAARERARCAVGGVEGGAWRVWRLDVIHWATVGNGLAAGHTFPTISNFSTDRLWQTH